MQGAHYFLFPLILGFLAGMLTFILGYYPSTIIGVGSMLLMVIAAFYCYWLGEVDAEVEDPEVYGDYIPDPYYPTGSVLGWTIYHLIKPAIGLCIYFPLGELADGYMVSAVGMFVGMLIFAVVIVWADLKREGDV